MLCFFSSSSHCCFSQLCLGSKLKTTMNAVCILVTEKLIGVFFTRSGISVLLVLNDYMLKGCFKLSFFTVWYILPYDILPSFIKKKSKEITLPMDWTGDIAIDCPLATLPDFAYIVICKRAWEVLFTDRRQGRVQEKRTGLNTFLNCEFCAILAILLFLSSLYIHYI